MLAMDGRGRGYLRLLVWGPYSLGSPPCPYGYGVGVYKNMWSPYDRAVGAFRNRANRISY